MKSQIGCRSSGLFPVSNKWWLVILIVICMIFFFAAFITYSFIGWRCKCFCLQFHDFISDWHGFLCGGLLCSVLWEHSTLSSASQNFSVHVLTCMWVLFSRLKKLYYMILYTLVSFVKTLKEISIFNQSEISWCGV